MHEQSETIQRPDGKWVNVYGRGLPKAGEQLPGTPTYGSKEAAVEAAGWRSDEMATWEIKSSDGRKWTVDAPRNIPEAEVLAFADEHADSWVNGGRYALSEEGGAPLMPAAPAPKPTGPTENQKADKAVAFLAAEMGKIENERRSLGYLDRYQAPALPGDTAAIEKRARLSELTKQYNDLKAKKESLEIGDIGQTVGGIGGSLLGGATGVVLGSPLGPPGMAVGGIIGSILGGAAGVGAGTHLWDIPEAVGARVLTDAEAAQLIRGRMIESLLWDGAFVLILGPGGKVIGKMAQGAKLAPALKAVAKQSLEFPDMKKQQMANVVEKRAEEAQPGLATQASDAMRIPTGMTDKEASGKLVGYIADQSGGHVPTAGEMRGLVTGGENFVRSQSPMPFFKNDQILAETAERIRSRELHDLSNGGAYDSTNLGDRLVAVIKSADKTLKRETSPVFERAAASGAFADMRNVMKEVETVLAKDKDSLGQLLAPGERANLEQMRDALKDRPALPMAGVQDFISGLKYQQRAIAPDGARASEYMNKVTAELVTQADQSYLAALTSVGDPTLVKDLLAVRKLYRETLFDLYSDSMATLSRKSPEDVGRSLITKGTVTEIRDLRRALDRAVSGAPEKSRVRGGQVTELGKQEMQQERARIDAGLVKGFLEKNTQSLTDLSDKLRDPDFRNTLKELLIGQGVADKALGMKVLHELDRTIGVIKLIRPEMAPRSGRIGGFGMGGIGAGTTAAVVTGDIRTAAPLVFLSFGMTRLVGNVISKAMTTGNMGALRTVQRGAMLAKAAGSNAAAAEALHGVLRELNDWDIKNGGQGLEQGAQ